MVTYTAPAHGALSEVYARSMWAVMVAVLEVVAVVLVVVVLVCLRHQPEHHRVAENLCSHLLSYLLAIGHGLIIYWSFFSE